MTKQGNENNADAANQKNLLPRLLRVLPLLVYLLLVFLRVVTCTFSGYIHPDEFFQGGQELFYGCNGRRSSVNDRTSDNFIIDGEELNLAAAAAASTTTSSSTVPRLSSSLVRPPSASLSSSELPWEFQRRHALRSIVPPMIMTLIPLELYKFFRGRVNVTAAMSMDKVVGSSSTSTGTSDRHESNDECIIEHNDECNSSGESRSKRRKSTSSDDDTLSGLEIWLLPRFFMMLLSIVTIDFPLWYILRTIAAASTAAGTTTTCADHANKKNTTNKHDDTNNDDRTTNQQPIKEQTEPFADCDLQTENKNVSTNTVIPTQMIIFASSWPTLLFLNRPFSNTLETMLLCLLLYTVIYSINDLVTSERRERNSARYSSSNRNDRRQQHMHACSHRNRHHIILFAIGIICSMGIFTRFTFAFFAFPVVLLYLHESCTCTQGQHCNKLSTLQSTTSSSSSSLTSIRRYENTSTQFYLKYYAQEFIVSSTIVLLGFISLSYLIIQMDCEFYNLGESKYPPSEDQQQQREIYVTPWNALRYNSQVANLSDHGIHPRFTHCAVNLPMLFGPLALMFYIAHIQKLCRSARNAILKEKKSGKKAAMGILEDKRDGYDNNEGSDGLTPPIVTASMNEATSHIERATRRICNAVVIVGLGILSCAPHQEPRFVLPLILPLIILHSKRFVWEEQTVEMGTTIRKEGGISKMRWSLVMVWVAFNILFLAFFGKMHQAALIPSLLQVPLLLEKRLLNRSDKSSFEKLPKAVIYYHTYMPPTFLLRQSEMRGVHEGFLTANETDNSHEQYTCSSVASSWKTSPSGNICEHTSTIDLKGSGIEILVETIESLLECQRNNHDNEYVLLVSPSTLIGSSSNHTDSSSCNFSPNFGCQSVWSKFQVSTEDMPQWSTGSNFISGLALAAHSIKCENVSS